MQRLTSWGTIDSLLPSLTHGLSTFLVVSVVLCSSFSATSCGSSGVSYAHDWTEAAPFSCAYFQLKDPFPKNIFRRYLLAWGPCEKECDCPVTFFSPIIQVLCHWQLFQPSHSSIMSLATWVGPSQVRCPPWSNYLRGDRRSPLLSASTMAGVDSIRRECREGRNPKCTCLLPHPAKQHTPDLPHHYDFSHHTCWKRNLSWWLCFLSISFSPWLPPLLPHLKVLPQSPYLSLRNKIHRPLLGPFSLWTPCIIEPQIILCEISPLIFHAANQPYGPCASLVSLATSATFTDTWVSNLLRL